MRFLIGFVIGAAAGGVIAMLASGNSGQALLHQLQARAGGEPAQE